MRLGLQIFEEDPAIGINHIMLILLLSYHVDRKGRVGAAAIRIKAASK
jgi:hypothetical protein